MYWKQVKFEDTNANVVTDKKGLVDIEATSDEGVVDINYNNGESESGTIYKNKSGDVVVIPSRLGHLRNLK